MRDKRSGTAHQAGNYCAKCGREVVGSEMALSAHLAAVEGLSNAPFVRSVKRG